MKEENLYCLFDVDDLHCFLALIKLSELVDKPEINLEEALYTGKDGCQLRIGQDSGFDQTRFVFDITNLKHLKRAFAIAQDFQK